MRVCDLPTGTPSGVDEQLGASADAGVQRAHQRLAGPGLAQPLVAQSTLAGSEGPVGRGLEGIGHHSRDAT